MNIVKGFTPNGHDEPWLRRARISRRLVMVLALVACAQVEAGITTLDPVADNWTSSCASGCTENNGDDVELRVRTAALYDEPPREIKNFRSLLRFDFFNLPALPEGSQITRATLGLYYFEYHWENPVGREYAVHRVTSSWDEMGSTWQARDGYNTGAPLYWESYLAGDPPYRPGGGDFEANECASVEVPDIGNGVPFDETWMTWDVTELVREWARETYPNEGLLVKDANEFEGDPGFGIAWGPAQFHSSDYYNDTVWPYLEVIIFGDFDDDGDVDLGDHADFHDCFTGPCGEPPCTPPLYEGNPGCVVADFEVDGDVDLEDYAAMQRAMGS